MPGLVGVKNCVSFFLFFFDLLLSDEDFNKALVSDGVA